MNNRSYQRQKTHDTHLVYRAGIFDRFMEQIKNTGYGGGRNTAGNCAYAYPVVSRYCNRLFYSHTKNYRKYRELYKGKGDNSPLILRETASA
jgi:hypothetical protein